MKSDAITFATKLLSKCIPVNVEYYENYQYEEITFEKDLNFSSMINYHIHQSIGKYLNQCETSTITNIITPLHTQYYVMCISKKEDKHLVMGPFVENPINDNLFYAIINNLRLNLDYTTKLKSYYQGVPSIDTSSLFEILSIINQYVTQKELHPHINTIDLSVLPKEDSIYDLLVEDINRNTLYKKLEDRYKVEDKLLSYIEKGDIILAQKEFEKFPVNYLEIVRVNDSVRNTKNLLLSTNTLFRKAAYHGGVHPIYLDELSGKWATKIEQEIYFESLNNMFLQMIQSYCLLTKEHSLSGYSHVVKNALTFINLNISSNLSVKKVAKEVALSPDYLTRLFKKEVGVNIITYINKKRVYTSLKLLKNTNLSIEDIGDLIGLNNTSYFYTLFKKEIGVSPKKYRSSNSSINQNERHG